MRQGFKTEWIFEKSNEHVNRYLHVTYQISLMDELFLLKAIRVIERNMNEARFGAEEFRKEIGISRSHLHRRLKSLTNRSTTGFIRGMRLKKAAELLFQRRATVSEIAYDTGFNNLSYFTSCFKKEFGVVPSAYFERYSQLPDDCLNSSFNRDLLSINKSMPT